MQVGIYPTRNLATLGILVTPGSRQMDLSLDKSLHVAMEVGLYLQRLYNPNNSNDILMTKCFHLYLRFKCSRSATTAVQHVVSEDSLESLPKPFLLIVRTCELLPRGTTGSSDIPAFSWILQRPHQKVVNNEIEPL